MPHFTNDGHALYYEVHGKGHPVVLVHGGAVSFERNYAMFGWIERLNARGLQVIGLDSRGHGKSDKPREARAYGTINMAGDVLALLAHLDIDRASIVGYSIGGAIALHLVHVYPERFSNAALVAVGDGLLGLPPYAFATVLPVVAAVLSRSEYPGDLPRHVAAYWKFIHDAGGDWLAGVAAASASYPPLSVEEASRIEVPVLVISGELDPVLGRAPRLARALARGRYLEVAGADHFALAADAGTQAAVAQFLADGAVRAYSVDRSAK